jgi:hypothetical protein
MTRRDQRKAARRPAGWLARFSPDGTRDGWSRCEVVDVSETGAGLIASGTPVEEGTRLTLELPGNDGDQSGMQLQGIVKHSTTSPDGTMHLGIEFAPDQPAVVVVKITDDLWTMLAQA